MRNKNRLYFECILCAILARPLIVRAMIPFTGPQHRAFTGFVWDVIDHMAEPEPYWRLLKMNYYRSI